MLLSKIGLSQDQVSLLMASTDDVQGDETHDLTPPDSADRSARAATATLDGDERTAESQPHGMPQVSGDAQAGERASSGAETVEVFPVEEQSDREARVRYRLKK